MFVFHFFILKYLDKLNSSQMDDCQGLIVSRLAEADLKSADGYLLSIIYISDFSRNEMLPLSIFFNWNKHLKSFINAKQPCQVEKHFSSGIPCCLGSSLRLHCWYSADNFPDPQSSLVTQQQAAW